MRDLFPRKSSCREAEGQMGHIADRWNRKTRRGADRRLEAGNKMGIMLTSVSVTM